MPLVGFEPTISAGGRPQTYALDRAATGTGLLSVIRYYITLETFVQVLRGLAKGGHVLG